MWWVEIVWDQYTLPETNIFAPETTGVGSEEFPFGKASLYRCELLVSESIFWWFLSLRRVMYFQPAWCFLLVLGSFLLTSLSGFPTNFLQMVLKEATHWRPTKINIHQSINPRPPNQASWPPNQSREGCCFFGTWNFIKFHGPQKRFLIKAPLGTLVMCL